MAELEMYVFVCKVSTPKYVIIENAPKISRILPNCICKSNRFVNNRLFKKETTKTKTNTKHNKRKQKPTDFRLILNFDQTRTVTVFGEHGIINNYSLSESIAHEAEGQMGY